MESDPPSFSTKWGPFDQNHSIEMIDPQANHATCALEFCHAHSIVRLLIGCVWDSQSDQTCRISLGGTLFLIGLMTRRNARATRGLWWIVVLVWRCVAWY